MPRPALPLNASIFEVTERSNKLAPQSGRRIPGQDTLLSWKADYFTAAELANASISVIRPIRTGMARRTCGNS